MRDMKHSVCHIMSMTLRLDLNAAAEGGWKALEGMESMEGVEGRGSRLTAWARWSASQTR